ncbi:hypothetical protein BGZ94_003771 [Podila epigama]|nr:hypothetical protein BGZ94_003771 [Podila epigama]
MSVKDPRLSQILPMIRCSDCGHDVQFRMLGEHVCSSAPPLPTPPLPPVKAISGVSSGGYKPNHKPPPIPISAPAPLSITRASNNYTTPTTPGRPSTSSPRPSLPFLEKYAKKNKSTSSLTSTPSTPTSASLSYGRSNSSGPEEIILKSAPLTLSPTTPSTPGFHSSSYANGTNNHYTRDPLSYFPKTPVDDRFPSPFNSHSPSPPPLPQQQKQHQHQQQQQQQQQQQHSYEQYEQQRRNITSTPPNTGTYIRSKPLVTEPSPLPLSSSPASSRTLHHPQPALPRKSYARSPSVSSSQGLGSLVNVQGQVKMMSTGQQQQQQQQNAGEKGVNLNDDHRTKNCVPPSDINATSMDYASPASSPPPSSVSSKFSRSESSGSVASSITSRRQHSQAPTQSPTPTPTQAPTPELQQQSRFGRDRSNTMQSERSERSIRSTRSERSRTLDVGGLERSGSGRALERQRERERERQRERGSEREEASYRPLTPPDARSPAPSKGRLPSTAPAQKRSVDQFDALMEDLIQEIGGLPASVSGTGSTRASTRYSTRASTRNSTRGSTRISTRNSTRTSTQPISSTTWSRSRPNLAELERDRDLSHLASHLVSPPLTPGVPIMTSERESMRSYRSTRESRAGLTSTTSASSGFPSSAPSFASASASLMEGRDRERPSRPGRDSRVGRDRERERDRTRASVRESTRSQSASGRMGILHCEGCKHDILGHESLDSVRMGRGEYHRECFKCGRCQRPFESAKEAHEYDGRLLCERDYMRLKEREAMRARAASSSSASTPLSVSVSTAPLSAPSSRRLQICAGCQGSIQSSESVVFALGKSWHEHHLSCEHCRAPIDPAVGHVEKKGRVYCLRDYGELFLPKCRGCGLPVDKEAVCAQDGKLEGKWHAACFGCHACKKPFPNKSFYVYDNAPYCRRHYHKMNNSLCRGCDTPIEGPCAQTIEGWRFHPDCFCCVECRTPLTDVYYTSENKAYCERDIMIIQRTLKVRAERRKTFVGNI